MNAISPVPPDQPGAARTARHLCLLEELAELGMELARAAAQQALAEWNRPPQNATASPAPETAASRGARPGPRLDPGLTFARVSRAVRQTIALEARIAAGDIGPGRRWWPNRLPADPRLPVIRRVLHAAAEAETDGAARRDLRRQIDERLDDLPEADPDGELAVDEIIASICGALGISVDPARLPDELLAPTWRCAPWPVAVPPDTRCDSQPRPRPNGPDPP